MSAGITTTPGIKTPGNYINEVMALVKAKNPAEPEFHQAVQEVLESLRLVLERHPEYISARILERIIEPERVIMFRVPWVDDQGKIQVNRGFRIEMNSAIGPYKGGLRFHPIGQPRHPQVPGLRAGLQELPDHAPHGRRQGRLRLRSQGQERQRSHALLPELHDRALPPHRPGHRRPRRRHRRGRPRDRLPVRPVQDASRNEFAGVLTGKGLQLGRLAHPSRGHRLRRVYFAEEMLNTRGDSFEGKTCLVSGSGNVAQYTVEKILDLGGKADHALRLDGAHPRPGRHRPREARLRHRPEERQARPHRRVRREVQERDLHADRPEGRHNPLWNIKADCAFPSATQNEINAKDAANLLKNGVYVVSEGANMPTTPEGVELFLEAKILYGPGKAANAGGVATSGLEMSQNSLRLTWTREEVDHRLHGIMKAIHKHCVEAADDYGTPGN